VNDNILAINIPNGVSILVIVALGFVLLAAAKKVTGRGKKGSPVAAGPTFANS
jgi:hypothetical protein